MANANEEYFIPDWDESSISVPSTTGPARSRLDGCRRMKLPHWWLLHLGLLVKYKEYQINKLWFDGKIETQQLMESNEDETAGI